MFEFVKQLLERRIERRRTTDFGAIDRLHEAENRSRDAHDSLMDELVRLRELLKDEGRLH